MGDRQKLLLIESHPLLRQIIRLSIPDRKLELEEAVSGKEGIRKIEWSFPDIVLIDLHLPDSDGIQVVEAIRKRTDVPIIALGSNYGARGEKESVLVAGADEYIQPPFSVGNVLGRIRFAIRDGRTAATSLA